ncbi:alpha-1,4-glucan--maltose-1-phosphate maltosyltransferase [Propioniciclava coleopterorum]|uniref:Alpha-1,4-glucan:maltose-1-phosphate maltosyltransferase n=1 Tax=Propioniciclava coleopterorum TaxID=2714937 RepID=A0A6G7YBI5_9ACTN|nr:alpha-1,4-glucan--maltose-1-phosphate maltosyltransferase [Propioniciclava coleopterorum]
MPHPPLPKPPAGSPVAVPRPPASAPAAAAQAATPTAPLEVDLDPVTTVVRGIGRIPVLKVEPVIEGGAYAAKAVVGENVPIRAKVFREGHDAVNASVILTDPRGNETRHDMTPLEPRGLDPWEAWVRPDSEGLWTFRVEGWSDPWGTWLHNAEAKLPAGVDVELVCLEGRDLLERTARAAEEAGDPVQASILRATAQLLIPERPAEDLLDVADAPGLSRAMAAYGPRELVSPTADFPLFVDRVRALYASWYEFFPRSEGARYDAATDTWASGTFETAARRLEAIADMGFNVVYLPPIHPIGHAFKKGKNNTLDAHADDPGSPWAIGNADGGHDAINPDLGDFASFDAFVAKANALGMEVALDFALQASPDHPWVQEHPEWFTTRIDGTIAYAENPPKKYQDIYPINFDNDPEGIYNEVLRILKLWIGHGVKIFRVDNPHTKPVQFWAWIFAQLRRTDPDVLFFAEAFTTPEMMHALGKVGFQSSYTYFTWRVTKEEITEYMLELSEEMADFYRPNFFVNTPDINPFHLQSGNPAIFAIRAILAATLSPAWGVYSGFELFEHEPLAAGREEYLDSEKYEFRPRDYTAEPNLNMLLGTLNAIRDRHPALQQLRQIHFHTALNDRVIAYSKSDGDDHVLCIVSLDPDNTVETEVHLDLPALGLKVGDALPVRDELTGTTFTWGARNFVRLTPSQPAHVLAVQ